MSTTRTKLEEVVHMPEQVDDKMIKPESIKLGITGKTYFGKPIPTFTLFGNDIRVVIGEDRLEKLTIRK
jgi:hypothetical protein